MLSVTKASLITLVTIVQHAIYSMNHLNSLELKVELLIEIEICNKGCINLINNWSMPDCARYAGMKRNYLRILNKDRIIELSRKK